MSIRTGDGEKNSGQHVLRSNMRSTMCWLTFGSRWKASVLAAPSTKSLSSCSCRLTSALLSSPSSSTECTQTQALVHSWEREKQSRTLPRPSFLPISLLLSPGEAAKLYKFRHCNCKHPFLLKSQSATGFRSARQEIGWDLLPVRRAYARKRAHTELLKSVYEEETSECAS
jgi:hypothetical protein